MNILDWSKNELDRLLTGDANKDDMQILINADILQMVKTFSEQGHSGFSAAYAISLLKRLLDWKPVQPLTGEDSEWGEIRNDCEGKTYQQNLRCSAVFRDNQDNATAYHIYGKVFSDDGGKTWFSNQDSVVPVEFPYHVPDKAEHVLIAPEQEV